MPIVEIPGVGQVEFPDSMDGAAISAAAKKLHFDAKVKAQQEADRKLYNPASDSFLGNLAPAAGAGMASILRAVGAQPLLNRMGLENLPQSQAEAERNDVPLDAAPGGTTGRVLGGAALLAPTAFIPGANTLAGSALIGGGTGLLTTEGDLQDRLKGGAMGAVGGLLGNLGGRAIGAGYRATKGAVKGLIRPFTQGGRDIIAGDAIERFATNPAAIQSAQGGASVTGAMPTLAEATRDPGIASLQRAIGTMDPEAAAQFLARDQANNAARVGLLSDMAGEGGQRAAAEVARDAAAKVEYAAAKNATYTVDSKLQELMNRPAVKAAMSRAQTVAQNEGRNPVFNVTPATPFAGVGGLSGGGSKQITGQGLQDLKMAMDEMLTDPTSGFAGKAGDALRGVRQEVVKWMETANPAFKTARESYKALSKPLNQMDVAQRLLDSTRAASADLAGNRPFQAASYARALNNEEQLVKKATELGYLGKLSDVMDPSQMSKINAIRSELDTVAGLDKAANGKGSQTAKMLASQQLLRNIAGPLGMPDSWIESGISQTLLRPVQFAANAVEPRIHAAVARGLLDPAEAQRLIQIARNANTATPSEIARLAHAMSPGLLGYGVAQAGQ